MGVHTGLHPSGRLGHGIEFGGFRAYVPGDDVRLLDRRSLRKHGRPLVRQYYTDRQRPVLLLVDRTPSMNYSSGATSPTKMEHAALLAASIARIAARDGDPVGLAFLDASPREMLPPSMTSSNVDRLVAALEASLHTQRPTDHRCAEHVVAFGLEVTRASGLTVLISDFLDLPPRFEELLRPLTAGRRQLAMARVLCRNELQFPFQAPAEFVALEGDARATIDPEIARKEYLHRLEQHMSTFRTLARKQGASWTEIDSDEPALHALRAIVRDIQARHA